MPWVTPWPAADNLVVKCIARGEVHFEVPPLHREHLVVNIDQTCPWRSALFELPAWLKRQERSCEPLMTTKLEVEKDQVRELEHRLAEAVKVLPFVPAGEFKKAKTQLDQIKDAIGILRASVDTRREN